MRLPTDYDIRHKWIKHATLMNNIALNMADWIAVRRRMREDDNPQPGRCSYCWNEQRREPQLHCKYCWGTGFMDGYYPIEIVRGSVSDEAEKIVRFEKGKLIISTPTATLPMEPRLQDEDLMAWILFDSQRHEIIDELWRYKIESVNYVIWDTEKIAHEIELVRLDARTDVELKIPFKI